MTALDLLIVFGYLVGIVAFGAFFSRRQKTTRDYFVGDKRIPWWAIAASIVATETSTITFISVPGILYARGGNFGFLQLVLGYLVGRVVISLLFIPMYFRGELLTVYQLLQQRFGGGPKTLAASLFVVMRNIADGVRLLLTAIVLAAVVAAFLPDVETGTAVVASIVLIGLAMIVFTYFGGMEAVIWVEVVQLGIYLAGAIAAAVVLSGKIDGGFGAAMELGTQFDKFQIFDFSLDLTKTYTFWAGLVGGTFLNMSTHGTDQYLVQRYLCTDSPRKASLALFTSGIVVLAQFAGFLVIGVLLFAFYQPHLLAGYADGTLAASAPFERADAIFPAFITTEMPTGLAGLVIAAIFAAALSSSLNSIAATAMNDLYLPWRNRRRNALGEAVAEAPDAGAADAEDRHLLRVSRWMTLGWGLVQISVALAFYTFTDRSALDIALSVASLFNGPVLGLFLVGSFVRRADGRAALAGALVGSAVMATIFFAELADPSKVHLVAWPWYAGIGSLVTLGAAIVASYVLPARPSDGTTTASLR